MRLVVHPAAISEARDARLWYSERNPAAADAFMQQLDAAIARLVERPFAWPQFEQGARRVHLRRFPYYVIYRVHEDLVEVVAVMHGRRRPCCWHGR